MEQIQAQVSEEALRIIAVNVLEQYPRSVRNAIARTDGLNFDRRNAVSRSYGIKVLPRMMMLDRDGRIAQTHTGYNEAMLETIVD